ncbi:carbohydrate ABC transporter permease [Leptotrichia sp. OH3620_COT-345]|nr:carbohydrate ABC transporter permease [Leptotrichia sp. OH3620_COT-345]
MKKSTYKYKNGLTIHTLLIIGSIFMFIPFIWTILTAFKTLPEAIQVPPTILPENYNFSNFTKALKSLPFFRFYFNTIAVIIIRVIVSTFFAAMAAYAFARIKFPGRNIMFMFVLIQMMVPTQIFIIPQYLIVQKLGMLNSIGALVFPGIVTAFGTFLLRQFFMGLPMELEEAAIIDGANKWQIFTKIMLPLARSGMISLSIFTALFAWKDLMWPLIVNSDLEKMPLSAGLAQLIGQFFTDYPVLMAGSILAITPMVIVFILFQKQFISGVALSGGK